MSEVPHVPGTGVPDRQTDRQRLSETETERQRETKRDRVRQRKKIEYLHHPPAWDQVGTTQRVRPPLGIQPRVGWPE